MTITEKLQDALRNPKWKYRTIKGLSLEMGLDEEDIKRYLGVLEDRGEVMFAILANQGHYWTAHIDYEIARRIEEAKEFGRKAMQNGIHENKQK